MSVVAVLAGALLGYGIYELNWWITRRQFPDLFGKRQHAARMSCPGDKP